MPPFLHDRMQRLLALLARGNQALAHYNAAELGLAEVLEGFLDAAVEGYRALGRAREENELLVARAQWAAARHGVDPMTATRVASHRRALERGVALQVLQAAAQRLRDDLARDEAMLADARQRLQPLLLVAHQKGLLPAVPDDGTSWPQVWDAMRRDADLALGARQVSMLVHPVDAQLLLAELAAAASPPPAPAPGAPGRVRRRHAVPTAPAP